MKRPSEADYTSQVAYTRALEAYCDAKREWVELTDEDWLFLGCKSIEEVLIGLVIEAKLKEKNT